MDFIDGLPKSHGKSVLLVVVDRLSNYAHFMPLAHPYNGLTITTILFDQIVIHGLSKTIVGDHDVIGAFGKELFCLSGTKLAFSFAYHLQSDSQAEVVNQTIEMYLCCIVGIHKKCGFSGFYGLNIAITLHSISCCSPPFSRWFTVEIHFAS